MRASSWASWALAACVAAAQDTGVVEIDLVFPRNETYAPSTLFPVVFAVQNSELAHFMKPIKCQVWDWRNRSSDVARGTFDMTWAKFSESDPYYSYYGFRVFDKEGTWWLQWTVSWIICLYEPFQSSFFDFDDDIIGNSTRLSVTFSTKNDAQEVDLVFGTELPAVSFCCRTESLLGVLTRSSSESCHLAVGIKQTGFPW